jgi:hypothetical protein
MNNAATTPGNKDERQSDMAGLQKGLAGWDERPLHGW